MPLPYRWDQSIMGGRSKAAAWLFAMSFATRDITMVTHGYVRD